MPILKSLKEYKNEKPYLFICRDTRNIYKRTEINSLFEDILLIPLKCGIDNLHCPENAVLEARNGCRSFWSRSFVFFVNGTTSGIYSMIMASASRGIR